MDDVFVFVDNSNLWIEGKRCSGRAQRPPVESNGRYRIEWGKLLEHVLGARKLGDMPKLYGSEPPPNDSVWKTIEDAGFDVTIFRRNIRNKEKGVDMQMGIDIIEVAIEKQRWPSTIAIVAGDADFCPVVDKAKDKGWDVEIWYWSNAARDLKNAATYHCLDPEVYTIGFDA